MSETIFFCSCFAAGFFFFLYKTFELFTGRSSRKFKDEKAEFTSDIFKLQQKWSKRGEYDFAKSLNIISEAINFEEEKQPETDYGKRVKETLERIAKEEEEE